jgi:hypothetical protein
MRNRRRQHCWNHCFMVCVTSVGLAAFGWAQAPQLCPEINSVIGYKILLDDIHFNSGSTGPQEKQLMDLLNFQLGGRLQDSADEPADRYHLVRCNGRVPQGEASFPPLTVEGLVNRDVVLELWGEIFAPSAGKHLVFLNYVMLPLPPGRISPFLQRQYQPKVGSSADEIVAWLADLNELDAYAKAARAVRLLSLRGPAAYDTAKADLEAASTSLSPAFGTTPTAAQRELLKFLLKRKCEILREARTNTDYKGPLRLLPDAVVSRECPAGGGL